MRRRLGGQAGGQRGQSMLEFALTLPILMIMLVGSFSVGRAAYDAEVLQEAVDEAGKVSVIDRLNPAKDDSFQMSDPQLLAWIRVTASTVDPTIDPKSITCEGQGHNPAWDYEGGEYPNGLGTEEHGGLISAVQHIASDKLGPFDLQLLNPSLETFRVTYKHNTGFGPGATIPMTYKFYATEYAMTWFPAGAGGQGSHTSC
ncbi:MAG: TadE-like protein [Chloroflexota bacterium]|jgi:hypothetical protein|nr:TadE-like protein [Chloroflexota bacterium]